MRLTASEVLAGGAGCALAAIVVDDWLAGAAVAVLLVGYKLLWTNDGLWVLPIAFTHHWMQTSVGVFYLGLTGRTIPTAYQSDYRPMVILGLGCCLALAAGIRLGLFMIKAPGQETERPRVAFSWGFLATIYLGTVAFEGVLLTLTVDPSIRQIVVTFDTARLGLLFLILRRLVWPVPRWNWFIPVLTLEVALGISGFFAGFREPVILAALAMLEIFDRRRVQHWIGVSAMAASIVLLGFIWMGIRVEYRRDYTELDKFQTSRSARVDRVASLTTEFFNQDPERLWATADGMVDRLWAVYYPALAVERVPRTLPHTNGEFLQAAVLHAVTPRILFPGKARLMSDSEKVRRYSGVMVAGEEQNTSIAFGYAAESYVDFGVPLMFLPVLGFGLMIGTVYALFRKLIWHRELFVAFGTLVFWLSLYIFERSWANMLGISIGLFVYLGIPVVLMDRFLLVRFEPRGSTDADPMFDVAPHSTAI